MLPSVSSHAVPFVALLTALMLKVWPSVAASTSLSFASRDAAVKTRPTSSSVVADSPTTTGTSFTAATFTMAVAVAVPPLPSLAVYWKLAAPWKLASGVNATCWLPSCKVTSRTVPWLALLTALMLKVCPSVTKSTSVSLANRDATVKTRPTSSSVVADSPNATGASLTAANCSCIVPVVKPPAPSLTR